MSGPGGFRSLRLDAERNREAILKAAAVVYAELGCDTSLEEVARRAGVGVGTIYRRFPQKTALLETLLEQAMTRYAEEAEEAARVSASDPWEALAQHVRSLVISQALDRAFSEVLLWPDLISPVFSGQHRRALRASLAIVSAARRARVARREFRHGDILVLARANHGLVLTGRPLDASPSIRLATVFLEGIRADPKG